MILKNDTYKIGSPVLLCIMLNMQNRPCPVVWQKESQGEGLKMPDITANKSIQQLEAEKKALVQRITRLRKRERLQECIIRKLQVRVNQLEEVLEEYLEDLETALYCPCPDGKDICDNYKIDELKARVKELLGKEDHE